MYYLSSDFESKFEHENKLKKLWEKYCMIVLVLNYYHKVNFFEFAELFSLKMCLKSVKKSVPQAYIFPKTFKSME